MASQQAVTESLGVAAHSNANSKESGGQNGLPKTSDRVSAVLHRTIKSAPPQVVKAEDKYVLFSDGNRILDTTCGAAVACIGYNNKRVKQAMIDQIDNFSYCNSMFFGHQVGEQLAAELVQGTDGHMSKAYIMCSGRSCHTEAIAVRPLSRY